MTLAIQGTVGFIDPKTDKRDRTYYSVTVGNERVSVFQNTDDNRAFRLFDSGQIVKGDLVELECDVAGKFKNVKKARKITPLEKAANSTQAPSMAPVYAREQQARTEREWLKQLVISREAAMNSALKHAENCILRGDKDTIKTFDDLEVYANRFLKFYWVGIKQPEESKELANATAESQ